MYWSDVGYLLSKNNFGENSIIIEAFTLEHGKSTGIVYGGSSRKLKKILQIGNKILINWRSKGENKVGYFNIELVKPVSPLYFDDKKRSVCILAATSILKILLPAAQTNKNIYHSFEKMLNELKYHNWINLYVFWEISLIKQLGFEINFLNEKNLTYGVNNFIELNDKFFSIPKLLLSKKIEKNSDKEIREALNFNKKLFMENFIIPNKLKLPSFRNILEKYYI